MMLLWFCRLTELDFSALMQVYAQSNRANGKEKYPSFAEDKQKQLAEDDFADYLRETFFTQKGAKYAVLAEGKQYYSALRLEPYNDGLLITALETRPDKRCMGYGKKLVLLVLQEQDCPIYSHIHKKNLSSLSVHASCGFTKVLDYARYLDGTVTTDSATYCFRK